MRLISELKRRNVLRMAVLYAVAAWLVMQVAEVMIGLVDLPPWLGPTIIAVLAVGFPIALIVSWFYELTPGGLALDKDVSRGAATEHAGSRRADVVIIAMLSAAVILFAYDKWWPEGPMEQSIAVLAFENLSNDPEQEYFSDGISEEILNLLAQIKPLKVIARTSSFSFKDKNIDVATIAERLNVSHVLEGSVRRSGGRIRITAQLIDATDSTHVWSQTYDREFGDVFDIQDEIAAAISEALRTQLEVVGDEPILPHPVRAANASAYDAYLKGRELFRKRGQDNVRAAIGEFERALRLDENFAPAHAQLAIATAFLGEKGALSPEEVTRVAKPHLDRAQALEPNLAEMHAGWGALASLNGDHDTSIEHFRRALAANPGYGDALNWLQLDLQTMGRYEEADAVMQHALTVDPLDHVVRFNYAEWLAETGRMDEARMIGDQLLTEDRRWGALTLANLLCFYEGRLAESLAYMLRIPHRWWASRVLAWVGEYEEARRMNPDGSYWVDADEGNWESAAKVWQEQLRITPDDTNTLVIASTVFMHSGRAGEVLPLLERALAKAPDGRPIDHFLGHVATLELAELRRQSGDEDGAKSAARTVREDIAAMRAAQRDTIDLRIAEAALAIFDKDIDQAIDALGKAVERGLRDRNFHPLPPYAADQLAGNPRFFALREHLDSLLAEEHRKVLQLICFNNPVPDDWQPLPETCEDVAEATGSEQ